MNSKGSIKQSAGKKKDKVVAYNHHQTQAGPKRRPQREGEGEREKKRWRERELKRRGKLTNLERAWFMLGSCDPSKIQEVTLMRPIHGNL